jgi:putative membrane protein
MTSAPAHWRWHLFLLVSALVVLIWSGIAPKDHLTWFMETLPAIAGGLLLVATYRRFPFTTVTYTLVWVFAIILMIGGHWTYAEVPIGNWARDAFGLSRNHYDRVGHFFQGVIPALLARELLLRTSPLRPGRWLFFICVCIALAVSAAYELFEWQYAIIFGGELADDFLGSQGDIWDAQKDMLLATLGAACALLCLSGIQDRQMARLPGPRPHA